MIQGTASEATLVAVLSARWPHFFLLRLLLPLLSRSQAMTKHLETNPGKEVDQGQIFSRLVAYASK